MRGEKVEKQSRESNKLTGQKGECSNQRVAAVRWQERHRKSHKRQVEKSVSWRQFNI